MQSLQRFIEEIGHSGIFNVFTACSLYYTYALHTQIPGSCQWNACFPYISLPSSTAVSPATPFCSWSQLGGEEGILLTGVKRTLQRGRRGALQPTPQQQLAQTYLLAGRTRSKHTQNADVLMDAYVATLRCVWIHMLISSIILLNTSPFDAGCLPPAQDTYIATTAVSSQYMHAVSAVRLYPAKQLGTLKPVSNYWCYSGAQHGRQGLL